MSKKTRVAAAALILGALLLRVFERPAPSLAPGAPVPSFHLADAAGKVFSPADFRGKILLLDFWATWCPACEEERPAVSALADRLSSRGLALLAISVDEGRRNAVLPYLASRAFSPRVVFADQATVENYRVRALPAHFLVDRRGRLVRQYVGPVNLAFLENDILKELEKNP